MRSNRKYSPDEEFMEVARAKPIIFPGIHLAESAEIPTSGQRPSWIIRAGIYVGALMSAPPPKVWSFNPSVVTLVILIVGIVAAGAYYMGRQDATINRIEKVAEKAEQKADAALAISNPQPNEEPTPTPKGVRK